jgi:hypothetical protein
MASALLQCSMMTPARVQRLTAVSKPAPAGACAPSSPAQAERPPGARRRHTCPAQPPTGRVYVVPEAGSRPPSETGYVSAEDPKHVGCDAIHCTM